MFFIQPNPHWGLAFFLPFSEFQKMLGVGFEKMSYETELALEKPN